VSHGPSLRQAPKLASLLPAEKNYCSRMDELCEHGHREQARDLADLT
jgi:hypothetical protein